MGGSVECHLPSSRAALESALGRVTQGVDGCSIAEERMTLLEVWLEAYQAQGDDEQLAHVLALLNEDLLATLPSSGIAPTPPMVEPGEPPRSSTGNPSGFDF